jgi:tRNA(fMet)-specific endonuclease VapC
MSGHDSAGWLLDTNVIIHSIQDHGSVRTRLRTTPVRLLYVPTIVMAELEYGSLKSTTPDRHRSHWRFAMRDFTVLPFDAVAAIEHARLRLALRHHPISERDRMIASIALANRMGVVTANTGEFRRVPKLHVEDWSAR